MGRFDGILICTDLDGTLYKKDKTISAENKAAIEYFKREGGSFTFITGRMPYYSEDAYNAVKPNVPIGCINGAGVYDAVTGQYVWRCEMPEGVWDLVEQVDKTLPMVGIQVAGVAHSWFCRDNDRMQHFRLVTKLPNLTCHYRHVPDTVAKIIFGCASEADILETERLLRAHPRAGEFDFVRSERSLFEILPKGVHKGLALEKLMDHLHTDPRKTIAIGDYDNDVGMLKTAGLGIAVANASKAALAAADTVTVSNEEHAIAQVISDLENGRYSGF